MLKVLPDQLSHLSQNQASDVVRLIKSFHCLFQDVPYVTTIAQHDINVNNARPIKQHAYSVNPTDCQQAFENAKSLLSNAPVLSATDLSHPYCCNSTVGAGAVLLQEDAGGVYHPVSYFFKKFNKHQYSSTEQKKLVLGTLKCTLGPVLCLLRWALVMKDYNLRI